MSDTIVHKMDACGLFCPEPVMMLHQKIKQIDMGECLEVSATDPSTERDIPKFCLFLEHELLNQWQADGKYFFLIQKQS